MKRNPRLSPYLYYSDLPRAVRFLTQAFGFKKRVLDRDEGKLTHATLGHGDHEIMLGLTTVRDSFLRCRNPKTLRGVHGGVYVFVPDVDVHCRQAKKAGAKIMMPPEDMHWGDRMYCAADPEGHFWMFASTTRHVPVAKR